MERATKNNNEHNEGQSDETDHSESYHTLQKTQFSFSRESSVGFSRSEILHEESPVRDDSAYHTYPHTSTHSIPKSSSNSSSRFSSEESLPMSSKKNHQTLIRIQLGGDDKKVSHEWYSEFTSQSHHSQTNQCDFLNSPLVNRVAKSNSQFEYDSHIMHMRGKY